MKTLKFYKNEKGYLVVQDLKKAKWYLERKISQLETDSSNEV